MYHNYDENVIQLLNKIFHLGFELEDNNRELLNLFNDGLNELESLQNTTEFADDKSLENDIYLMKDDKMSLKDTINGSRDGNLRDTLYYCNEYFDLMMSDTLDEDIVSNDSQGIIFSIALDKRNYNVSINFIENVVNNYDKINFHDDKIKSIIEDCLIILDEIEKLFKGLFAHYNL